MTLRTKLRLAALAALAAPSIAATGANPWVGRYAGHLDGADGKLTIRALPGGRLSINLWAQGKTCVGGFKETAPASAQSVLIAYTEPDPGAPTERCSLTLRRLGSTVSTSEDGCTAYHGGECDFDGLLHRIG